MVYAMSRMPNEGRKTQVFLLTPSERALLRLLVSGYPLEEAAPSLGLSPADARLLLEKLQARCGASSCARLIALAVLNAWV